VEKETFYLEEFKALRNEIDTKLKGRFDFHNWGLIGLGVVYSYIFSNLEKSWAQPWLFFVPVALSLSMVFHLVEEHRMVALAGQYIRNEIERWIRGGEDAAAPMGWENYLNTTNKPARQWNWSPVPLWLILTSITTLIAIAALISWIARGR